MTGREVAIWGRHPVLEALKRGAVREIVIAEGQRESGVLREVLDAARSGGVSLRRVPAQRLEEWAPGERTQGVVALVAPPRTVTIQSLLAGPAPSGAVPLYVVLDQVQDPHNLGALLRTADAAGVHAVLLPDKHSAPLSGTVAKSSAGALHHVRLVEVRNLRQALDLLRENGIWIVGLDERGRNSIFSVDLTIPTALVLGGEGEGLRQLTREHCDLLAHIPMAGTVSSLNVSVAGGVAMFEAVRQRASRSNPVG